ncbi:MAG TPA: hypothetical protein VFX98_10925 [Longimicrobiaceae bacterium]|nr:hypothetical protein [Longimicrobiaceae bacterium]
MSTLSHPLPRYGRPTAAAPAPWRDPRVRPWVQGFILFQLVCQLALLIPGIGPARIAVRMAAFGASLALLVLLRGRGVAHPAAGPAVLALAVVGMAVFHPDTTNLTAGIAQAALYAAVLAPLFWVPRLTLDGRALRRTVMILWGFHSLSAGLGVLQVYFPGRFQPPVSSVVMSKGKGYLESLKITTATGQRVYRPMGLTDVPGGASISGLYAVLFGMGFFLTRRSPWFMAASMGSMGLGMMCLALSQVRSLVVMTGITVVVVGMILVWRRDVSRLMTLIGAVVAVVAVGWIASMSLAGPTVQRRMGSLVRDRPSAVYYSERGRFLDDAFTQVLPQAPFGSGLGHWGMMATYFGNKGPPPPNAKSYWVEIQWAGWIVDGGAPLMITYFLAIVLALLGSWRIARSPPARAAPDLPFWGAIVFAYGVGALALTFSYPIFLAQAGMEFWLLNAALFAAARHVRAMSAAE